MELNIGRDFTLPIDAVTQTFAVLAKRGVGKTYTASVMAEEMLSAEQQVVALDPTGAWWGLRSKFPVVIIGGEHADVPLEESAGEVIARAIVENRFSAVIDLSLFRKGQMIRFVIAFAETLYRLNREPVHLFVDEADAFAPQGRSGFGVDESRMLGAMEDIVRRGRKRGIGCTLITQRPAVLNKNVLTQAECLVALRLVHPKDVDAVEEWVNVHADPVTAKEMTESLPSLPVGTAWFWSPGWGDFFRKVKVRKRITFDSGATPKPGEKQRTPAKMADIDLAALGGQIRASLEQAKANDPAALRKRVAELEHELATKPAAETKIERVEVPVITPEMERALGAYFQQLNPLIIALTSAIESMSSRFLDLRVALTQRSAVPTSAVLPKQSLIPPPPIEGLTAPQQAILDTVLMLNTRGIDVNRDCVARWLGIHPNGGSYGANLGRLRADGYLDGFSLTEAGRKTARTGATGYEAAIVALDDEPKRRILRTLRDAGRELTRDELAAALGIHPNGGSYGANLGWLRTMGLITERGPISLTAECYR